MVIYVIKMNLNYYLLLLTHMLSSKSELGELAVTGMSESLRGSRAPEREVRTREARGRVTETAEARPTLSVPTEHTEALVACGLACAFAEAGREQKTYTDTAVRKGTG